MLIQRFKRVWNPRFYSTTHSTDSFQTWAEQVKKQSYLTRDQISPSRFNLFSNTLPTTTTPMADAFPKENELLPPGWHHIYFPPRTPESQLAADGYETEFFPPPPFSQRMWAGAKYKFSRDNPLKVGDNVTMKTYVDTADRQVGRMGEQATVWINKDIENENGWSMTEQRCLVYHPQQTQSHVEQRGIQVRKKPDVSVEIMPTSILLFRYSALTFNSHKIHFDHEYATKIEKHPACLVHGPLSGNLLLDMIYNLKKEQSNHDFIESFEYKCLVPLYVNQPMTLCAKWTQDGSDVWIVNQKGHLAVKGSISYLRNA